MPVFTHTTVGTNNLDKARKFYDAVLAPLGLKRIMDMERGSAWGTEAPEFFVLMPLDGNTATPGPKRTSPRLICNPLLSAARASCASA